MARMKDIGADERPRERMLAKGPETLTDAELVAVLLRTGVAGKNVVELSTEILRRFGGLRQLVNAGKAELTAFKGLGGGAKAASLIAAVELARRCMNGAAGRARVAKPADVFAYCGGRYIGLAHESFIALYLNSRNEVIGDEMPGSTTASQCICHPQEFVRGLIRHGASRLVLVHNHPSGDPAPSAQDVQFTDQLARHLAYFGFELLDHVIVAGDSFTSMKETGRM